MRKADYELLAQLILATIHDRITGNQHDLIAASAKLIALTFSARAHVDKASFLKACGIE